MLRGYHPLKEVYRWERVIFALWILFSGVVTLENGIEYSGIANHGDITFFLAIPPSFLFVWFLALFPVKRRLTKLFRLQGAVLDGQYRPVLLAQPDPVPVEIALPFSVSPFTSRSLWRAFSIFLLLPVCGILAFRLPLFLPDPYVIPPEAWLISPLLWIFYVLPGWLALSMVADFYLLPLLTVDESGITACYGPDRVRISWQQIRCLALVEYKRFGSSGIWTNRESVQIYTLCDGENTIAWYANPRRKTRQPASLSLDEYARLLDAQLPALVRLKTGLPLLDLCEPKREKSTTNPFSFTSWFE